MSCQIVKLGDVCTVVSGSTPKSNIPEYWDGDIKWITPAEIDENSYIIMDSVRHLTMQGIKSAGLHSFPAGTVILSSRAPIGKTAIAGCEMYCNQGFKNLVCSKYINNEYLYFYLSGVTERLNTLGRGATFKELSKEIVENIEIPLPSIDEQVKISRRFKIIKELTCLHKKQRNNIDLLVSSRFSEMFESNSLQVKTIEELCSAIIDCPHTTPKYKGELKNPAIRTSEIKKGYITWDTMRYVSDQEYEIRTMKLKPKAGDIVYGREGTFGNAAVLPEGYNFCLGQRVMLLRPDDTKCTSKYLLYAILSDDVYRQAVGKNNTSTVAHVNVNDVKQFKIPLPSLDKQIEFAVFVNQTDKSKLAVQKSLDKLETLKKSLMQQYFG